MNPFSFDSFNAVLEQYKNKTYQELCALPAETKLSHQNLSAHDTLHLLKTVNTDQSLTITLKYQRWLTAAEYKQEQTSMFEQLSAYALPADAEEVIQTFKKYFPKPVAHPSNPDLLGGSGYENYFEIHPDGMLVEDEATRNQKAEDEIQEEAPWFGTTGLDEETEREVPRYLRLEYGEFILDEDSLKARDLTYLGRFQLTAKELEEGNFASDTVAVHFWRYPASGSEPAYAYVEEWDNGDTCIGMGSYFPTKT